MNIKNYFLKRIHDYHRCAGLRKNTVCTFLKEILNTVILICIQYTLYYIISCKKKNSTFLFTWYWKCFRTLGPKLKRMNILIERNSQRMKSICEKSFFHLLQDNRCNTFYRHHYGYIFNFLRGEEDLCKCIYLILIACQRLQRNWTKL